MTKLWIVFAICIVTFLAGLGLGYQLFSGQTKIIEKDKPAVVLHDTSIVIERKTDTVTQVRLVKVPDTKVIHEVELQIVPDTTIKLDTLFKGDTVYITKTIGHDTILVTMHILKEKNGGIRVQAKATNGKIVERKAYIEQFKDLKSRGYSLQKVISLMPRKFDYFPDVMNAYWEEA